MSDESFFSEVSLSGEDGGSVEFAKRCSLSFGLWLVGLRSDVEVKITLARASAHRCM